LLLEVFTQTVADYSIEVYFYSKTNEKIAFRATVSGLGVRMLLYL